MLPSAAPTRVMRFRDAHCEALLRQLGRGSKMTQPVLLSFTGAPAVALAAAARTMASRLGRPLLRVDLGAGASPYIGETEKNLKHLFSRAESSGAVLLFDEADALFGARSEAGTAGDRYANLEVSYLLARLESYHGVVVLSFNSPHEAQRRRGRLQPVVMRFPAA